MRICTPGCVAAVLLFVLLSAVCAGGPRFTPDLYQYYSIYGGWQDNEVAWFICTSASSIAFADSTFFATIWNPWFPERPVLAPRLADALTAPPRAARPMYLVVNSGQGPVFDTKPGLDDYSGLWQTFLVRFYPGFLRPVTNTSTSDPRGLPMASEGEITETNAVLDAPIVAIGELGGPATPSPSGSYRIPQAALFALDTMPRSVLLPVYYVYTSDPVMAALGVTDVETQDLADMFGANLAPRLARFPEASTKSFWVMDQPCPSAQLPVVEQAPWWQARAYNPSYSPAMRYSELGRLIPPSTMITNRQFLQRLLDTGLLFEVSGGQRINTNVVRVP